MAAEQEQGASNIIKMLCDAGANIDERAGASNETPLILAAYYGDTQLVMFLVEECGAGLEVKSGRGDTGKFLSFFFQMSVLSAISTQQRTQ
jgi:ankyrin repeat protein